MIGDRKSLSSEDRLCLIQTLNALPMAQFDELIFALAPPKGNIPRDYAPQSYRSQALLEWVESPIGPGILEIEKLLAKLVAENTQTSPDFISFVISGKINNSTTTEIKAFVELLRKKTGDKSIDFAFYKEGSINIVLTGSTEALESARELYELGELDSSEILFIEDAYRVKFNTSDARKAKLIQLLRLRIRPHIFTSILKRSRNLIRSYAQEQFLDSDLDSDSNIQHRLIEDLNKIIRLASAISNNLVLSPLLSEYLARSLPLASEIKKPLVQAANLALDLDLSNARTLDILLTQTLELATALDHSLPTVLNMDVGRIYALDRTLDLNLDLSPDFNLSSNLDLRNADLTYTNLSGVNFIGVDLTGADLTGAEVTGAIFAHDSGLSYPVQLDLLRRGAVFQDSPHVGVLAVAS